MSRRVAGEAEQGGGAREEAEIQKAGSKGGDAVWGQEVSWGDRANGQEHLQREAPSLLPEQGPGWPGGLLLSLTCTNIL